MERGRVNEQSEPKGKIRDNEKRTKTRGKLTPVESQGETLSALDSETETHWEQDWEAVDMRPGETQPAQWQRWDWDSEQVPAVSHSLGPLGS